MAEQRNERGTTLLLFPAAVLVLLLLGGIAVDMSTVHLARRELLRTAGQAADDAAAMLDETALRNGDGLHVDVAAAERVVRYEFAVARLPGRLDGAPTVVVDDARGTVTVTATVVVHRVFGRVATGGTRDDRVTVQVSGRMVDHR